MFKSFKFLSLFAFIVFAFSFALTNVFAAEIEYPIVRNLDTLHNDFEVVLLDFDINNTTGASDTLETISLNNETSGHYDIIWNLTLWSDSGAPGFQGMTIDNKLGNFSWNPKITGWLFDDIDFEVLAGSTRYFITADFKKITGNNDYFQVRFHPFTDYNNNGSYDYGEYGVFMGSDNDGPEINVTEYNHYTIKNRNDYLGPKIFTTNITSNQTLSYSETFNIKGIARDRGDSFPSVLKIKVNDGEFENITLGEATNLVYGWEYSLKNIIEGQSYTFTLQAFDVLNNKTETSVKNVVFKSENVVVEEEEVPPVSNTEVSFEKSTLTLNRDLGVRAPFEDSDINAVATILDNDGNPVVGKLVTINVAREGKDNPLTLQTDLDGKSMWVLTSRTNALFTLTVIVDEKELSQHPTINFIDASLGGELIKGESTKAVYLLKEGKRYVFPNQAIYKSYYEDFSTVKEITDTKLASYQLGKNITYRPGSLIKIPSMNKVYRVNINGELNWIGSETLAKKMYGPTWASIVHDINDSYFGDYTLGEEVK